MVRIVIADDHVIVRKGLKQLLALAGDIEVIAEASDGEELLRRLADNAVDLILLDMCMPGLSGVEMIVKLRAEVPAVPILVLSMRNESQLVQAALRAGAAGYLTKDNEPDILMDAIRQTAAGNRFIDPQLATDIILGTPRPDPARPSHDSLSRRQLLILRLLAQGKNVSQIAEQLSIKDRTVSTHKARLMQKMNFRSNFDLLRYCVHHGLV